LCPLSPHSQPDFAIGSLALSYLISRKLGGLFGNLDLVSLFNCVNIGLAGGLDFAIAQPPYPAPDFRG
jgi:hypothetical protein